MRRSISAGIIAVAAAGAIWAGMHAGSSEPGAKQAAVTAIRNVRLFDGTRAVEGATVVFSGNRITAAGRGVEIPRGAEVLDGTGKTLLPGFIDAHVHLFPGSADRALRFGVTTELDMFTNAGLVRRLMAEQKAGDVPGRADVLSAQTLVTVAGGHGTEYFPIPTFVPGGDAQAFVDARIAEGSDYIKLIYDDGSAFHHPFPTLTKADLTKLIAAAHARHKLAVVHVSAQAAARDAIAAGADGLAHLFGDSEPAPDFGTFAKSHGVFVVPTLTVIESTTGVASGETLTGDRYLQPYLNATEAQGLKTSFGSSFANREALKHAAMAVHELKAAGVPILAGTDAPNPGTAHGASMHRELQLLVAAGLTPAETLAAATSVPARIFGLTDRGRIAPGLRADLVLVNDDPTSDITATRRIDTIWKDGVALTRNPEAQQAVDVQKLPADMLAAGAISDFEDGTPATRFGSGWQVSTDAMMNGASKATMTVVAEGAAKFLRVHAESRPPAMYQWAGAMLFFGSAEMRAVDLSSRHGLVFTARGDTDVRLMAFSAGHGRIPLITTVHAPKTWGRISVPWSQFGMDGADVQAVLFAGPADATADFDLDDVGLDAKPVH